MRYFLPAIASTVGVFLAWNAHATDRPPLTVDVQQIRDTLDPGISVGNWAIPITTNVFDTLVRRDFMNKGEGTGRGAVPGLAVSWRSIDERTLEMKLRPNVKFQDGEALTSEDVKYTFERILDPKSAYTTARSQLGTIVSVDALDPETVVFHTKEPDAILVDLLATPAASIVPKTYIETVGLTEFGQHPVGTGPYKVQKFSSNQQVNLGSNDDYWGGKPPASNITFKVVPEVSARITALINGEADIITSVPPDQLKAIGGQSCCQITSVLVNSQVLNYNTSNAILKNRTLRQAMNLAIDRDLLSKALWDGKAQVLRSHQYPEWGTLYDDSRAPTPFDKKAAADLVKQSGYNGEEIQFYTHPAYYNNGLAAAQAIAEMWKDVGINARVMVNEKWSSIKMDDPSLAVRNLSDWSNPSDPEASIHWSWTSTALWDGDAEKKFDELGKEARRTLDPAKRKAIYHDMLDIYATEAPGSVLYRVPEYYGLRKGIKWRPYTEYTLDFRAGALAFD
ncbi:ABC transporter substrate-binding protein [Sinorhizobium meliloti]|uniref:ABC transporter substrate-binding protein n=1 Tax=Rhizobium meliloti TaxID=382 RepID=UPI000FDB5ADF|nr:ABC transporter substrate-binding protein [Sinorhizobium meliloti]RVM17881.1 hypothetical protein CN134_07535 [Sinorhizobium meliloti]RVO34209.1 hypothetical protein CN098_07190 [Sinorhizobium meliloti]